MKAPLETSSPAHTAVPRSAWNDESRKVIAMRKATTAAGVAALSCVAALGLAACGSSGTAVKEGGTATVLMGTAPDFLDPQEGYTTQAAEPDWISYTPLLT
jgi:CO/xanthine dehydrogenase Mo-binding subunit